MINRILALLIRYKNISFGSFPRLLSIFYWPTVQILFWGYFTNFFMSNGSFGIWSALNIILSAVVLWDVLFRGQLGLTMSFFEELWSRNLPNLFITPLKDIEMVYGLILISLIRTLIGITPAIFFANYFFDFHLFELGLYLIFLFVNLIIFGWSIGFIVSGLVLRYGQAFEELAWAIIFIILPFSCVYCLCLHTGVSELYVSFSQSTISNYKPENAGWKEITPSLSAKTWGDNSKE